MAVFRRGNKLSKETPPKAVLAAAMPLVGPGVGRISNIMRRQTTEAWQNDAWYYYDAIGELRAPLQYIANAVSQATPFAAETDPETGLVTGPTDNVNAQRAVSLLLGGPARRAQFQQTIALCWQVPGEAFIVIRPVQNQGRVQQPDEWLVLAGDRVHAVGGTWEYMDPATMQLVQLGPNDRLIRVWSPHPRDQIMADTSVRPALPILREIERCSMNIASRLDSRLAGNGVLAWPQEINFPTAPGQSQAAAVSDFFVETASASLSNPGTASAHVPIVVEMPSELIAAFKDGYIDFSTNLDEHVVELRDNGLQRLAATLDMPREVAAGTQGESNHWSAWQVEETTYKMYIEPLLSRIGDALTEYWFRPVLQAMGVPDPERYVIEWDVSEIIARPDSTEDQNWLYEHELISDDARRAASGVPDDDIPSDEELQLRRLVDIVKGAPTLAADPQVSEALFGLVIAPAAAGVSDAAIEADPGSGTAPSGDAGNQRALPDTQDAAQAADDVADGLVAAAEFAVFDALSRAGKRLLTREHRGQFGHVRAESLYLTVPHDKAPDELLEGSFAFIDEAEYPGFTDRLRSYAGELIRTRTTYQRDALRRALR